MCRDNQHLRTNSGKQDGGGERGRQPISFRSCEHTDQKAAQAASGPPGPLSRCEDEAHRGQAEGGHKQSKVEQTGVRVVQSQDDLASQRREEVGKLQEDRSKAVLAKAISEATAAVVKASAEAQSYIADVRKGRDGTLSSGMNSPIEQFEKSTEAILRTPQRRTSHRVSESDDDDEERGTRMRSRSPRLVTNRKDPV